MTTVGAPLVNTPGPSQDDGDWMDVDSFDDTDEDTQIQERITVLQQIRRPSMEDSVELQRLGQQVSMKARRARVDDESDSRLPSSSGLFLQDSENEHRRRQRMPTMMDSDKVDDDDQSDQEVQNKRQNQIEESEEEVEEKLRRAFDEMAAAENELSNSQSSSNERFHDEQQREEMLRQAAINDVAGSRKKRKRAIPIPRGPRPKNAKEAHTKRNQVIQEAEAHAEISNSQTEPEPPAPKKRGRKPKNAVKGAGTSAKGRGKGKSKVQTRKKPKQSKRPKVKPPNFSLEAEQEEYANTSLKLMTDDAVADKAGHGEAGPAPKFTERQNKNRALKELMASVPKDFKRHVTNDKKVLLRASKMFGHGNI
jgi:hypothetical protein